MFKKQAVLLQKWVVEKLRHIFKDDYKWFSRYVERETAVVKP